MNQEQKIQGLPQKQNDLFSFYGVYNLTQSFNEIVRKLNAIPPSLTIITNKNKFKCHLEIAAAISNLILEEIESNPQLNEYKLKSEFDDSNFNLIIDFLNGVPIKITDSNREYIKYAFQYFKINQSTVNLDTLKELTLTPFSRQFYNTLPNIQNNITLTNSKEEKYQANYLLSYVYCQVLKKNEQSNPKEINVRLSVSDDIADVSNFLNGNNLRISFDNFTKIKECFSELQITSFDPIFYQIDKSYEKLSPTISVINLQDTILAIDEDNVNQIFELLSQSDYLTDPSLHHELLLAIEICFSSRPRYYQKVIDLLSLLLNKSDSLHNSMLSFLYMRQKCSNLMIPFLRMIYDNQMINLEELLKIIKAPQERYNFTDSKLYLILFFARELFENDIEFFKEIENHLKWSGGPKLEKLKGYIGNWDEYSKLVSLFRRPGELCTAVFNDDADLLQKVTSLQPDFDYDQKLQPFLFEPFKEIDLELTLSDLAAFYGSVKCFKFLMLQHADLSKSGKFAIFGGNNEIIRLIEQDGNGMTDLFYCAIKYHHYELFNWLLLNHGPVGELYKHEYNRGKEPLIPLSISVFNHRTFLHFYEKGINEPKPDRYMDNSLLKAALKAVSVHALRLLISIYKVDSLCPPNEDSGSILFDAVEKNSLEILKILVESGKFILNKKIDKNPLIQAAKNGSFEMVEYLLPFYKDDVDSKYVNEISKFDLDPKIREMIVSCKK